MSAIINTLDALYRERGEEIESWFGEQRKLAAPYLYNSIDLRHGGYKLVPVDTNMFPAGFNNLSAAACRRAITHLSQHLLETRPDAKKILIVPENHTRNQAYFENLRVLRDLISEGGFDVRIGSLSPELQHTQDFPTPSGGSVTLQPAKRNGNQLETEDGFSADLIVLNNDMTSGIPEVLENLSQPILPPPRMGWHQRRKSVHFKAYNALAKDFCQRFSLDPWLISTEFHACGHINFREQTGIDCVAKAVDSLLKSIADKYAKHGISEEPYVFIKADSGTYGMGIMTVKAGDELFEMNKKTRNKMNVIKEGTTNTEVIIQEGVPTIDKVNGAMAEPMIYVTDGIPVGGAYRVNAARDERSNLNAQGMEFTGMCDESEFDCSKVAVTNCNFRVFGLIAAIAALAAAREQY